MRKLPRTPTVSHGHDASTLASNCKTVCGYRKSLELAAIFHQDSCFFAPPGIAELGPAVANGASSEMHTSSLAKQNGAILRGSDFIVTLVIRISEV